MDAAVPEKAEGRGYCARPSLAGTSIEEELTPVSQRSSASNSPTPTALDAAPLPPLVRGDVQFNRRQRFLAMFGSSGSSSNCSAEAGDGGRCDSAATERAEAPMQSADAPLPTAKSLPVSPLTAAAARRHGGAEQQVDERTVSVLAAEPALRAEPDMEHAATQLERLSYMAHFTRSQLRRICAEARLMRFERAGEYVYRAGDADCSWYGVVMGGQLSVVAGAETQPRCTGDYIGLAEVLRGASSPLSATNGRGAGREPGRCAAVTTLAPAMILRIPTACAYLQPLVTAALAGWHHGNGPASGGLTDAVETWSRRRSADTLGGAGAGDGADKSLVTSALLSPLAVRRMRSRRPSAATPPGAPAPLFGCTGAPRAPAAPSTVPPCAGPNGDAATVQEPAPRASEPAPNAPYSLGSDAELPTVEQADPLVDALAKIPGTRTDEDVRIIMESLPGFSALPAMSRTPLAQYVELKHIRSRDTVIVDEDGAASSAWHIILHGSVQVTVDRQYTVMLEEGCIFGGVAGFLYRGELCTYRAKTVSDDCQLAFVAQEVYQRIMADADANIERVVESGSVTAVYRVIPPSGATPAVRVLLHGTDKKFIDMLTDNDANAMPDADLRNDLALSVTFITPEALATGLQSRLDQHGNACSRIVHVFLRWAHDFPEDFVNHPQVVSIAADIVATAAASQPVPADIEQLRCQLGQLQAAAFERLCNGDGSGTADSPDSTQSPCVDSACTPATVTPTSDMRRLFDTPSLASTPGSGDRLHGRRQSEPGIGAVRPPVHADSARRPRGSPTLFPHIINKDGRFERTPVRKPEMSVVGGPGAAPDFSVPNDRKAIFQNLSSKEAKKLEKKLRKEAKRHGHDGSVVIRRVQSDSADSPIFSGGQAQASAVATEAHSASFNVDLGAATTVEGDQQPRCARPAAVALSETRNRPLAAPMGPEETGLHQSTSSSMEMAQDKVTPDRPKSALKRVLQSIRHHLRYRSNSGSKREMHVDQSDSQHSFVRSTSTPVPTTTRLLRTLSTDALRGSPTGVGAHPPSVSPSYAKWSPSSPAGPMQSPFAEPLPVRTSPIQEPWDGRSLSPASCTSPVFFTRMTPSSDDGVQEHGPAAGQQLRVRLPSETTTDDADTDDGVRSDGGRASDAVQAERSSTERLPRTRSGGLRMSLGTLRRRMSVSRGRGGSEIAMATALLHYANLACDNAADLQVIKVYRADMTASMYLPVLHTTTAMEVIQSVHNEFDLDGLPQDYRLVEVRSTGLRHALDSDADDLAHRSSVDSRYYIVPCDAVCTTPLSEPPQLFDGDNGPSIILNLSAIELARQLTLYDAALFLKLQQRDYVRQLWKLDLAAAPTTAPEDGRAGTVDAIRSVGDRFNQVNGWVASAILREPNVRKRALMIQHFIKVCVCLKATNNFNSLFAIVGGLNSPAVRRLRDTWARVSPRYMRQLERVEKLMDPSRNMRVYRAALRDTQPPFLPFFPLLLKDMQFAYDGNASYTADGLINFEKLQIFSSILRQIDSAVMHLYKPSSVLSMIVSAIAAGSDVADDDDVMAKTTDLTLKDLHRRLNMTQSVCYYCQRYMTVHDEAALQRMSYDLEPPHLLGQNAASPAHSADGTVLRDGPQRRSRRGRSNSSAAHPLPALIDRTDGDAVTAVAGAAPSVPRDATTEAAPPASSTAANVAGVSSGHDESSWRRTRSRTPRQRLSSYT